MSRINIPDEYKEKVKSYVEKLAFEDKIEQARKWTYNAYTYAYMRMHKDPEYLEAISEIEKRFIEKYKKEYRELMRSQVVTKEG